MVGAASLAASALDASVGGAAPAESAAAVLYDDRTITLDKIGRDPAHDTTALWIRRRDLPRVNDFELKPQGACRADVCITIAKNMTRGEYFNVTAFAHKIGQSVVADSGTRVWSFGEIPLLRGGFLESRIAPDVAVPDRTGRPVHLASFRGKKVLVVTWASW
jgi:hypothetical protein